MPGIATLSRCWPTIANGLKRLAARGALLACVSTVGLALAADSPLPNAASDDKGPRAFHTEFQFVRMHYSSGSDGFGRDRWLTDWPEAEQHLTEGIRRLTRIRTADDSRLMSIMDEELFDYPWIYAVEVGYWQLSEEEAVRLREYLLRGGFLMVDDFHGSQEWDGFFASMRRVFPDKPIVDIARTDSVFHDVYDLDEPIQIPGIGAARRGITYERDGVVPTWRGIYDDSGRLMVIINHNMDLGDAWEHADIPDYAVQYTVRAYQHTINYIVYAMTH